MSTEIRKLDAGDVQAYRALRLRAVREHPEAFLASYEEEAARTEAEDRQRLMEKAERDDDFVLGAFEQGELVGMVGVARLSPHRAKGRHRALLWGMYVAPQARRRRWGEQLMNAALDTVSRAEGIELVQLAVGSENPSARALYERLGFEAFGVEKRAMKLGERWIDEVWMVRFL